MFNRLIPFSIWSGIFIYKSKYEKVGVLPIWIVKSNVSSVGLAGPRRPRALDFTIRICSSPTVSYFDLHLYSAYSTLRYIYIYELQYLDYRIWCFKLILWPPRCSSSAQTILLSELKFTSFWRRENVCDVVYRTRTVLRLLLWDYKFFILFVLHGDLVCFEGRVVELQASVS